MTKDYLDSNWGWPVSRCLGGEGCWKSTKAFSFLSLPAIAVHAAGTANASRMPDAVAYDSDVSRLLPHAGTLARPFRIQFRILLGQPHIAAPDRIWPHTAAKIIGIFRLTHFATVDGSGLHLRNRL